MIFRDTGRREGRGMVALPEGSRTCPRKDIAIKTCHRLHPGSKRQMRGRCVLVLGKHSRLVVPSRSYEMSRLAALHLQPAMATSFISWSVACVELGPLALNEGAIACPCVRTARGTRVPGGIAVALVSFPVRQPSAAQWEKGDPSRGQGKAVTTVGAQKGVPSHPRRSKSKLQGMNRPERWRAALGANTASDTPGTAFCRGEIQ